MATVYISATGNDTTGAGTLVSPWLTITKAVAGSASNDTIRCLSSGGPFSWNYTFDGSGTSNRFFVGDGAEITIFDAGGANINFIPGSNYAFQDLQFTNLTGAGADIFFSYAHGSPITCAFTRVIFRDMSIPTNRSFFGNATAFAINYSFTYCLFDNLFTTNNAAAQTLINTGVTSTITMTGCTFYNDKIITEAINIFGSGGGGTMDLVAKNCIFYTAAALDFTRAGATVTVTGSTNVNNFGFTNFPAIPNTITSDPLFVDAAGGVFALRPESPAIGAGVII